MEAAIVLGLGLRVWVSGFGAKPYNSYPQPPFCDWDEGSSLCAAKMDRDMS